MRRTPYVLAATAAGLAGVLAFHTHAPTGALSSGVLRSTKTPAGGSKSAPPTTAAPASAPPGSGAASAPSPSATRVAVGKSEQYGYGVLSVKVTVQGQRITDVSLANLQTAESYSQQIAVQVIPMLRQEVLAAQSVQVNGISGATYTAEAYVSSIQSALNKLHFK